MHKTPFGTVRTGQLCSLTVCTPKDCGAVGVGLILEDPDGNFCREVSFALESQTADYQNWTCRFTMERGLYFYWFRVYKADGSFRLFKQGRDTNMEAGEKWQLSFIPEDFTVPDYARGAVMYQIFPDRFAKHGDCDLSEKLQPFTVHADWSELPRSGPDAEGNWNNDFFGGNFNGIREKLPYLQGLGVKMLYLNPIFKAFSNHRYDTADYLCPDPMLGTEEEFAALCDEAHRLGMRVILDGVFSHTGNRSIYFESACNDPNSPYYKWYRFKDYPRDYEAWWGIKSLPCVEELEESYLEYIINREDSVVAHWLKLGADGFRLDVADELPDEFILRLKQRIRELKPEAFLLGEVWEDASNKRAYGQSRRYFVDGELDSVMNYPWREAILHFITEVDDGTALAESVMKLAENYPPQVLHCVMNLLSSHDKPRILTLLGKDAEISAEDKAKYRLSAEQYEHARKKLYLGAFLQYTLPGIPSIYYGDEAGLEGFEDPWCRRTFPWGNEDETLQNYFRRLAELRNTCTSLQHGSIRVLQAGQGRLCYVRQTETECATIYINRTEEEWQLPDTGKLYFGRGIQYLGEEVTLLSQGFCILIQHSTEMPEFR